MSDRLLLRGGTVLTMVRGEAPRRADVLVDFDGSMRRARTIPVLHAKRSRQLAR